MKKYNKFMIKLIFGMAIITIIMILLVLFTEYSHIGIVITNMVTNVVYMAIMLIYGFKKRLISWR